MVKIQEWLRVPKHPNFLFRIAVKEVEAWLLADQNGMASFLGVRKDKIPVQVEQIPDPQKKLIEIAGKSRKRDLREAIVPDPKSTARVGPDYNGCLIEFVYQYWNIDHARYNSPSLDRAVKAVQEFKPTFHAEQAPPVP